MSQQLEWRGRNAARTKKQNTDEAYSEMMTKNEEEVINKVINASDQQPML